MELLIFLGTIIATIVGITSAIFGVATLVFAITETNDWNQKFIIIYALLGWFVIGMWLASYIG